MTLNLTLHKALVLATPWRIICWKARVTLGLLCVGGALDLYRVLLYAQ